LKPRFGGAFLGALASLHYAAARNAFAGFATNNYRTNELESNGARYEIAVDGKPRSYRDINAIAMKSAQYLKSRNPNVEVTVRDLERVMAITENARLRLDHFILKAS
jgi:hypothetical protein